MYMYMYMYVYIYTHIYLEAQRVRFLRPFRRKKTRSVFSSKECLFYVFPKITIVSQVLVSLFLFLSLSHSFFPFFLSPSLPLSLSPTFVSHSFSLPLSLSPSLSLSLPLSLSLIEPPCIRTYTRTSYICRASRRYRAPGDQKSIWPRAASRRGPQGRGCPMGGA